MIKYNKRKSTFMLYLGILCSISLIGTMTGCERQPKNVMNNNSIQEQTPPIAYNIYIENSGSMVGYCNFSDANALETLVGDYYDRLTESINDGDTVTLNFINTSIVPSKEEKNKFLSSIKGKCTAPFTKIDQMLEMMMNNVQENDVNILVSDYVFSTNQGNPQTASSDITKLFTNQLKTKDFTVAMFKYMVNFKGKYYPGGLSCNKPLPIYIWIFGKEKAVKHISELPFNSQNCGKFLLQKSKVVDFEINAKNKRMVKGNSIDVTKWNPERKQTYYEFNIKADLSSIMLNKNAIVDISKYKVAATSSSMYQLKEITPLKDGKYEFTIRTQKPSPSKLLISYPISTPQWVNDSNFSGSGIPSDSTTLNIKYLIDGVSKAFTNSGNNVDYFRIEVELK